MITKPIPLVSQLSMNDERVRLGKQSIKVHFSFYIYQQLN